MIVFVVGGVVVFFVICVMVFLGVVVIVRVLVLVLLKLSRVCVCYPRTCLIIRSCCVLFVF